MEKSLALNASQSCLRIIRVENNPGLLLGLLQLHSDQQKVLLFGGNLQSGLRQLYLCGSTDRVQLYAVAVFL